MVDDFLIARNPDELSRLPYLLYLPLGRDGVVRARPLLRAQAHQPAAGDRPREDLPADEPSTSRTTHGGP